LFRCLFKLVAGVALLAGLLIYLWVGHHGPFDSSRKSGGPWPNWSVTQKTTNPPGQRPAQTWGNPASLPDHFARHGADFGARSPDEYARLAEQFLRRARMEGLPAKVDDRGVLRIFDPATRTFGAYNRNGTAKTFFKPGSSGYFDRQPGQRVDLRTLR
jgi:hypothetical protein